jgi:sugar-specific transcriptional regulator TrmB
MMLERFGFSPTESRVYAALLQRGAATGYAVALDLGIARANVYQALEELVRRGAARKSASNPVQYLANGPAALIAELEHTFRRDVHALEEELQSLPIAGSGVLELELLTSVEQLLARAASCIDVSISEVFVIAGPWAGPVNARLEAARSRKLRVHAVTLDESAQDEWGGLPVVVVSDRGRSVCGLLSDHGASGIATTAAGVVPLLRQLVRASER